MGGQPIFAIAFRFPLELFFRPIPFPLLFDFIGLTVHVVVVVNPIAALGFVPQTNRARSQGVRDEFGLRNYRRTYHDRLWKEPICKVFSCVAKAEEVERQRAGGSVFTEDRSGFKNLRVVR